MAAKGSGKNIEAYTPSVQEAGVLATVLPVDFSNAPSVALPGNVTTAGNDIITSNSANALTVGRRGTTFPVFNVDASVASVATGLTVQGQAAGNAVTVTITSSGNNENGIFISKGTGAWQFRPGTDAAGIFQVNKADGTTNIVSINSNTASVIVQGSTSSIFVVGPNGATNPALNVDTSTANAVTGLSILAKAATGEVVLTATSPSVAANLAFNTVGTGKFRFSPGTDSTSAFAVTKADGITNIFQIDSTNGNAIITSASATAFTVGANGSTNPVLQIDNSASTQVAGISIKGGAANAGVTVTVISSGTNENFNIFPKGTGAVQIKATASSTNAFNIQDPTGGTNHYAMTVDTTNLRVGINKLSPTSTLDVAGDVTVSAHNIITDTTTGMKIGTATTQKLGFFNATPVVQVTQGATLTNGITSGGSANTLANYTDLTVYANDAAAIRNNLYQMGQTLKTIVDGVRTLGLFS